MNFLIKIFFFNIFYIFLSLSFLLADNTYFIDYSKVLNNSKAGSAAQSQLQKIFETENKKFLQEEENIKKKESDLISQKKVISQAEYQKKLDDLRKQVADLQTKKQNSLNSIAKSRAKAKQDLLQALNPIIKRYMEENKIRLIVDKQSVILGDTKLEITDQIIEILNQQLKLIKLN